MTSSGGMRASGAASAVVLGALLSACAGPPPTVSPGPTSNIVEARRLLLTESARGPVPLIIDRAPDGFTPERIAELAERGARDWTAVDFVPQHPGTDDAAGAHLVFRFAGAGPVEPQAVCDGRMLAGNPGPQPEQLHAVFCEGGRPVADSFAVAAGTAENDVARLVSRTTASLFPGERRTYGLPGVSVFGGVGLGSGSRGGVGVGLGF
jgi:hypothetical protein